MPRNNQNDRDASEVVEMMDSGAQRMFSPYLLL